MPFGSFEFFVFLPLVFVLFLAVRGNARRIALLVASVGYYAFLGRPWLVAALAAVTTVSYVSGLAIAGSGGATRRRLWFWCGVASIAGVLVYFKTLPLSGGGGGSAGATALASTGLARGLGAIGVSFFSFQAISYLVDVHAGTAAPERRFGDFALYMAFFPKLTQGPIERARDLLPQLRDLAGPRAEDVRDGMILFAWGLFNKAVIADRIALYVNPVFDNVHGYPGGVLLAAVYLYAVQIFCDFSGYTDMALGTARLFGVRLAQNFESPYLATSIVDFWRRWHISFSRWILDYLFMPLQMTFRGWGAAGTAAALMLTFLASGLWHGVTWGFVLWGLCHGLYMTCSTYWPPARARIHAALGPGVTRWRTAWQVALTFHMVCLSWVFFRARSVSDAFYMITHIRTGTKGTLSYLLSRGTYEFWLLAAALAVAVLAHPSENAGKVERLVLARSRRARWAVCVGLVAAILLFEVPQGGSFIYFQF